MNRRAVSSDQAPKALGPCSQAIVAGGLVFCSGMAGTDPASGTIPRGSKPRPSGRCSALPPCSSPPGRPWRTSSRRRSSTPTPRTSAGSTRSTPGTCPILRPPGLPRADVRLPLGLLVPIEAMAVLPGASASLGGGRDGAGHRSSPALSRRREAGQRRTPTASLLLATSAPVAVPERPGVRASAGRTPVLKRPSMLPIAMRPHARRSVTAQCSFCEGSAVWRRRIWRMCCAALDLRMNAPRALGPEPAEPRDPEAPTRLRAALTSPRSRGWRPRPDHRLRR
jgi:2-iminobutanoate/2-iminopropanoate deaminase